MSNLSDDEGLFDDIYGDDNVQETKTEEVKEKSTAPAEPATGAGLEASTTAPPPPPTAEPTTTTTTTAAPIDVSQITNLQQLDPQLLEQLQRQLQLQVQQQVQKVQRERASLSREQGKMFIGGLNWETSEDGLRLYFEKFGEVTDLTIMKDANTSKSRGFGFMTFADPASVDKVVSESHVLDGKLIDPKRAIPREEQDKTGKIFVGGIAPEVNEQDFNDYFSQFGHIIDAQLMIDKDTGRSRGFGFVTYDSPDAVDKVTENKFVMLKGRNMEIKRAQPRGQQNSGSNSKYFQQQQYQSGQLDEMGNPSMIMNQFGVNPEMAQQYWQQMQQYFMQQMQQQYAANGMTMDPSMMQQYQQQQLYSSDQQQDYGSHQQQNDDQDQVVNIQQQELDNLPRQPRLSGPRDVPANLPRGPRAGNYRDRDHRDHRDYRDHRDSRDHRDGRGRGRGRGRGGYRSRGGYHPYNR